MTNNLIMNGFSTSVGAVISETSGDWKPVVVSLVVALFSECVKYIRRQNAKNNQSSKESIQSFFNGIIKSNKRE